MSTSAAARLRRAFVALWSVALAMQLVRDAPVGRRRVERGAGAGAGAHRSRGRLLGSCSGHRPPLPDALYYELRSGAFPGSGHPDVAVHVPPGFDATQLPGVVVYFHGWNGCVAAALSSDDMPCTEGGAPRPAARLSAQTDEARVNALLVAVELRYDMPTGEPGELAASGGMRELLRELLEERLADPLGCRLDVDELDRVVVIAHSGGYQAAAGALAYGDLPQITEVDLLDAYYGADDVFGAWVLDTVARFDGSRRFVDLYTCCGGTVERSRSMARLLASDDGADTMVFDDDSDRDVDQAALAFPVVIKRTPAAHPDLPRTYFRALIEAAGFARIEEPDPQTPDAEAFRR
jgi:hypothetical protein